MPPYVSIFLSIARKGQTFNGKRGMFTNYGNQQMFRQVLDGKSDGFIIYSTRRLWDEDNDAGFFQGTRPIRCVIAQGLPNSGNLIADHLELVKGIGT
jgi:hypothetical protein